MDAALLETSLALVDTPDDGLTTRLYAILFDRYPAVRPMFSEDMGRQAKMLRSAIVAVVDHLDDPIWLTETLGSLGARHASWGVVAPMYDAVTECMVAAMAELGGDAWTAQMTDAWVEALDAVSGLMLLGYPSDAELAS
ncbi:globin domain-containing protein [Nocardioides pocheonensis]|uniref:Flavoprotein n=1 Tax=Nocardioides pocheonensis TaxID=661485 RepID=A0A3N0GVW8_9ACTN|nr:globin domain-containing protein [Nocardioides pocheonensis]RNM16292.1 flavoprotein [Nocardioides pocheonensis]